MATDADAGSESSDAVRRGSIVIEDTGAKVFKVEDTLFTVHIYFLVKHSPVFRDMLEVAHKNEGEGLSEDNAIVLEDIPAHDFDMLVRVLYTPCALMQTSPLQTATVEECASLIKLLERWQMDEILAGVRQVLHDRDWDLADRIALAGATEMNAAWFSSAYQNLILRDTPPTLHEGARMGWPAYGLVRDIREKVANLPRVVQTRIMREELGGSLPEYEAQPVTQSWDGEVHNAVCDICGETIIGPRLKCLHPHCPDWDHCMACEAKPNRHPANHPFIKIKQPAFGTLAGVRLLTDSAHAVFSLPQAVPEGALHTEF